MPRRDFLKSASAAAAGFMVLPSFVAGQSATEAPPSEKINIAIVGVSGKGRSNMHNVAHENIVALCDVDMGRINRERQNNERFAQTLAEAESKGARWFTDYRIMFEEMADQIDAVVISTPDHMHYPIAASALNLGKHVYCEKPLTHTVAEAESLRKIAEANNLVTQMGNQGHSNEGARVVREWIQAGVLGQVREVYSWTNRPVWPQGQGAPDHSQFIPVTPKDFHWDLWLGVANPRPYDPAYAPFKWRGYLDFGTGAFGDMACHILDPVHWALDLGMPTKVEASSTNVTNVCFPSASVVKYRFAARGKMDPVDLTWYSGGLKPPAPVGLDEASREFLAKQDNGSLFVGENAVIFTDTYGASLRVLPAEKLEELKPNLPPKTIERVKGTHQQNWLDGIHEKTTPCSNFSYAGPFTEMVLLGPIAVRAQMQLHFDPKAKQFTNSAFANSLLQKPYPAGWIIS